MAERYERLLRIICLVLGGVLLLRIGWVLIHHNPLAHLKIPAVPTLAAADAGSVMKNTNQLSGTNIAKNSTNTSSAGQSAKSTNSTANHQVTAGTTNVVSDSGSANTNRLAVEELKVVTNSVPGSKGVTNTSPVVAEALQKSGTNSNPAAAKPATNDHTTLAAADKVTATGSSPGAPTAMAHPSQNPGMPPKPRELPAEIQARVDRVTDSEILGPVMRPLPMALLGIAGNVAFLRAPSGQTGLVKEGDELGGLKLLRIGVNRVLVEQEGQKKELMMFSGFGGDPLLPK
jgi:hypothetical protein